MSKADFFTSKVWAVIGASDKPERIGSTIYHHLKKAGYTVLAINPTFKTVDGDICYPDLRSLPQLPDVIDMVVNPNLGEHYIREAAELGIHRIWFQPGTWRSDFAQLTQELGIETVQSCVLVEIESKIESK
ncbi:MAG: putative CoA-binding protein [Firmicutes bacterium]|nr:putative CoA-binding protein [Bacillota bacterium]